MYPEDGNIRGREGFIARPVEGGTWISSALANGGLHDLPPNEQYVKATAGAMRTFFERAVPLGSHKGLTYFAMLISATSMPRIKTARKGES